MNIHSLLITFIKSQATIVQFPLKEKSNEKHLLLHILCTYDSSENQSKPIIH